MPLKTIARRWLQPVLQRLDDRAAHQARVVVDQQRPPTDYIQGTNDLRLAPPERRLFVPPVQNVQVDASAPFMQYATCSAADVVHPRFEELITSVGYVPSFHRKLWEIGYVMHHLLANDMLRPGTRGLGFGVGSERLPARFASLGSTILASDAPSEISEGVGWRETDQHSLSIDDLPNPGLCPPDEFLQRVTYRPVDMNNIDNDLTGFDYCWSACCFEHLGSIRHGLEFVKNSLDCLAPGGVAVHTTELNLSSNNETLESEHLSLFRRSDLQSLINDLRADGHTVSELTIAPDAHYLDHYVDLPPYGDLHMKLELEGYVTTSVGLVIQKRR